MNSDTSDTGRNRDTSEQAVYRCPACGGEFPASALEKKACVWCGLQFGEADQSPITHEYKAVNDRQQSKGILRRLFE